MSNVGKGVIEGQLTLPLGPMVRRSDWQRLQRQAQAELKPRQRLSSVSCPIVRGPESCIPLSSYEMRIGKIISRFAHDPNVYLIQKAFYFAEKGHAGQNRKSGEPYIEHPVAVAEILADLAEETGGIGAEVIAAGLLHDLREDAEIDGRRITKEVIREEFGERVFRLVEGLTELGKEEEFKGEKPTEEEIQAKLFEYAEKDLMCFVIKLADRLHNMQTLEYIKSEDPEKAKAKATETLYIYCRIADILGMWELKRKLEDISFFYLNPDEYSKIAKKRVEIIEQTEAIVDGIVASLQKELEPFLRERLKQSLMSRRLPPYLEQALPQLLKEMKIKVEINKEERHVYELYERMRKRDINLNELSGVDVWRVNVVIPEGFSCYLGLEAVHSLFPPVKGELEDNLPISKPNGHRFWQTYVHVRAHNLGRLLIQIRDQEMFKNYRYGILTKEGVTELPLLGYLHDYFRLHASGRPEDLYGQYEAVSSDSTILVFSSPESGVGSGVGELIQMPGGSTALDFARKINPKVFLYAKSATINDVPSQPLSRKLKTGDRVFIEIGSEITAKLEWLDWVFTSQALETLQSYLLTEYLKMIKDKSIIYNRVYDYLDTKSMASYLPARKLIGEEFFKSFLKQRGFDHEAKFLDAVAKGEVNVNHILRDFMRLFQKEVRKYTNETDEMRKHRILAIAEDRPGLKNEIEGAVKELGINCSSILSYNYSVGDEIMSNHLISAEVVPGIVGGIQKLQLLTLARKTKSVLSAAIPTKEMIDEVIAEYVKRESF